MNLVILKGNVGKAPEIKNFEGGSVARFSLATTEKGFKTQAGKEIPDETTWHNITCWRGLAKLAEGFITSGTGLLIQGKIKNSEYTNKDGVKQYKTEIIAEKIEFTGGKSEKKEAIQQQPSAPAQQSDDDDLPF